MSDRAIRWSAAQSAGGPPSFLRVSDRAPWTSPAAAGRGAVARVGQSHRATPPRSGADENSPNQPDQERRARPEISAWERTFSLVGQPARGTVPQTLMDIRQKIQTLLATPNYHPLRRHELAAKLRLNAAERRDFRRVLAEMLEKGDIVRVRTDRFVLPQDADLVVGTIEFHPNGFAFVRPELSADAGPETEPRPDVYVAGEDTSVALNNDKVVVRLHRDRSKFKSVDKPSGQVIRILERASDTIVGTLQKGRHVHYVIPDDPRMPHDVYTKPARNAQVGDKVVVKLAEWTSRHVNPEGEIVEVLGKADAPGVDILAII